MKINALRIFSIAMCSPAAFLGAGILGADSKEITGITPPHDSKLNVPDSEELLGIEFPVIKGLVGERGAKWEFKTITDQKHIQLMNHLADEVSRFQKRNTLSHLSRPSEVCIPPNLSGACSSPTVSHKSNRKKSTRPK